MVLMLHAVHAVHAVALCESGRRLQLAVAVVLAALVVLAGARGGGGPARGALESPFLVTSLLVGAVLLGAHTRVRQLHVV